MAIIGIYTAFYSDSIICRITKTTKISLSRFALIFLCLTFWRTIHMTESAALIVMRNINFIDYCSSTLLSEASAAFAPASFLGALSEVPFFETPSFLAGSGVNSGYPSCSERIL